MNAHNPNTADILKSLGDETRLSMVRELVGKKSDVAGSKIITGCSEALKLSQPTLSHHFSRLEQSGVLISRKVGSEKYYKVGTDLLLSIGIDPAKL